MCALLVICVLNVVCCYFHMKIHRCFNFFCATLKGLTPPCPWSNPFRCGDGSCIDASTQRCNGVAECADSSDEADCVIRKTTFHLSAQTFLCSCVCCVFVFFHSARTPFTLLHVCVCHFLCVCHKGLAGHLLRFS